MITTTVNQCLCCCCIVSEDTYYFNFLLSIFLCFFSNRVCFVNIIISISLHSQFPSFILLLFVSDILILHLFVSDILSSNVTYNIHLSFSIFILIPQLTIFFIRMLNQRRSEYHFTHEAIIFLKIDIYLEYRIIICAQSYF